MKRLFETGFGDTLFLFGEPLSGLAWGGILVGFLFQHFLLKKVKRPYIKRVFPALLLIGIAVSEYLTWIITGWDLPGVLIVYWGILCLILGAGMAWVAYKLQKRRENHEKTDPSL